MRRSVASVLILFLLAACRSSTPSPRLTPLPTRMQPADAAQQALAQALSELDYDLSQARSLLSFAANAPEVHSDSAGDCTAYMLSLQKSNPQYIEFDVATPDGNLFCTSNPNTGGVNLSNRLYFQRVLNTHTFAIGEYVAGHFTSQAGLGLAYPIVDKNQMVRVLVAPLNLSWLADRIAAIDIPVTGEIVLMDTSGGVVLRDPDTERWYGQNISQSSLAAAMLSKTQGAGEYSGADGQTRLYSFSTPPAATKQLFIAAGIPK